MTNDDLLKMLDLDGKEPARSRAKPWPSRHGRTNDAPESCPRARRPWTWTTGACGAAEDVLAESERLRECLATWATERRRTPSRTSTPPPSSPTRSCSEACVDPRRQEFVQQLLETPEYHACTPPPCSTTRPSRSPPAAFAEQFAALHEGTEQGGTEGTRRQPGRRLRRRDRRPASASGRALAEAAKEVEEAQGGRGRAGHGAGLAGQQRPQGHRRPVPPGALRPGPAADLRAGRPLPAGGPVEAAAEGDPRPRRRGRASSLDGDVGRLLPHELAKLAVPELEDDTLRRLVERQAHVPRVPRASSRSARGRSSSAWTRAGSHAGRQGPHGQGAGPGAGLGRPAAAAVVRAGGLQRRHAASGCWPCRRAAGTRRR